MELKIITKMHGITINVELCLMLLLLMEGLFEFVAHVFAVLNFSVEQE